jgi:hypothetical protein
MEIYARTMKTLMDKMINSRSVKKENQSHNTLSIIQVPLAYSTQARTECLNIS